MIVQVSFLIFFRHSLLVLVIVASTATAQEPQSSLFNVSIEYRTNQDVQVALVWGVDEWQVPPADLHPEESVVKGGAVYSPMISTSNGFKVDMAVPDGTRIDFVFRINRLSSDEETWDTNPLSGEDYTIVVNDDVVVSIDGAPEIFQFSDDNEKSGPEKQYITFFMPQAGKVDLIWGINGWQAIPESLRTPGTRLVNGVMRTPMQRAIDGIFVGNVAVPEGASLQTGFRITEALDGRAVNVYVSEPNRNLHKALQLQAGIIVILFILFFLRSGHPANRLTTALPLSLDLRRLLFFTGILGTAINLALIGGTRIFNAAYRSLSSWDGAPWVTREVFVHFNLGTENVFASWYSSMLFLFVAMSATLCFIQDKARYTAGIQGVLNYGWLFIAALFAGLSLDEVGSLHERIGVFVSSSENESRGWVNVLLVPVLVVSSFMMVFAWSRLRRTLLSIGLIGVGTCLYVTNPFLENLEMELLPHSENANLWRLQVYMVVEEGFELFGSLAWMLGLLVYLEASGRKQLSPGSARSIFIINRPFVISTSLCVLWGLALLAMEIINRFTLPGDAGVAQHWFPASVCGVAALLASFRAREFDGDVKLIVAFMGVVTSAVVTSIIFGTMLADQISKAFALTPFAIVGGINALFAVMLMLRFRSPSDIALLLLWVTLTTLAGFGGFETASIKTFAGWLAMFVFLMSFGPQARGETAAYRAA